MALSRETFIPGDPKSIDERLLNKGIARHIPTVAMPPGSVLDAQNCRVTIKGIRRRDGLNPFTTGSVQHGPVSDITLFWDLIGTQQTLVIDQKFLYFVTPTQLTPRYWTYSDGTVDVTGDQVTGTAVGDWTTEEIRPGDVMVLDPGEATEEVIEIASVGSATEITLMETSAGHTGVPYVIRRAFGAGEPFFVDYTFNGDKVLFADGVRQLYSYDGTTFEAFGQTGNAIPNCVTYFNDRIFIGRTQEGGVVNRQRIRWSRIGRANHHDFPAENFIDLPYTNGELLRLVPLGNLLIAYFSDAIYIGQGTNNPNLPVTFQRLETGFVGLVGMKAVAPWTDGHYFVGQDDVYFLSNRGLERIGTPIKRLFHDQTDSLWKTYAATDPQETRVAFGVSQESETLDTLFSFDYEAKAWAYSKFDFECVSSLGVAQSITWADLTETGVLEDGGGGTATWSSESFANFPTWSSLSSGAIPEVSLYYGRFGQIWRQIPETNSDAGMAIPVVIVTRDEDFQTPDFDKLWTKMTIKLEEPTEVDLEFEVEASVNRGRTWKNIGPMRIPAGFDEGKVDFRLTGQLARFRLESNDLTPPWLMVEFVYRASVKGQEVPGRGPSAES